MGWLVVIGIAVAVVLALIVATQSLKVIGPTQIGLVNKRLGFKKLGEDQPIAFNGEAGYQAELLMPGLRFKLWPVYSIQRHPWVQIAAGDIGVVIAQIGKKLPTGAKSGRYQDAFGNFSSLRAFLDNGGEKGVQRPVLPPGTLVPVHPIAFLVITRAQVYGLPVANELRGAENLSSATFGLTPEQLRVVVISPVGDTDVVGVITALEGDPLPPGDIASRLGGYADVAEMESRGVGDPELMESLLGAKNALHNNYQDFQAFLDNGGHIGLQHDPLLYGAYLLNPFLLQVELAPMLVVNQGEVAVVKSYVGLPTLDTSGAEFKFGSIVRPGHRGIWQEPLRTGKYALNPRCYAHERVPTSILTLNWANAVSQAHNLDAHLNPIEGKSREGFVFKIDLQVQIHVPDTRAPKVISMVGTMNNLVNEVLQSAVGNHFRNTLQSLEAVRFIETRQEVQAQALLEITEYLDAYEVETRGVYIQDVEFPVELVEVLTKREIANQEKATFEEEQRAQVVRVQLEKARGTADMQAQLAQAQVSIDIKQAQAEARKAEADGEASYLERTGQGEASKRKSVGVAEAEILERTGFAEAEKERAIGLAQAEVLERTGGAEAEKQRLIGTAQAEVTEKIGAAEATKTRAVGLAHADATQALGEARARGYEAQVSSLGAGATAAVAVADAVALGKIDVVPEVLVTGGGGALDGLAAVLMRTFGSGGGRNGSPPPDPPAPVAVEMDSPPVLVSVPDVYSPDEPDPPAE